MFEKLKIVGVMGSGKQSHENLAVPLGHLLAQKKCHVLNGAGKGTMTSVAKSYVQTSPRFGKIIGIIPCADHGLTPKEGYPNPYVEITIYTPLPTHNLDDKDAVNRNHLNIMSSDLIIALPGTKGTKNEVDIVLTMKKPIIGFGEEVQFEGFSSALEITNNLHKIEKFIDSHL